MERKSRGELLEIIEKQSTKILAYRQKLHDVIEAYKGACKEKEALESSFKALGATSHQVEASPAEHPLAELEPSSAKVSALSDALKTLTNEKSRIEGCLVAEKKKLMQDLEAVNKKIEENQDKHNNEVEKLQKNIQELKWNMGKQQQQHEDENKNHVLMLRELQMLLSSERDSKLKLENQLEKFKVQKEGKIQKQTDDYEITISSLRKELSSVQEKLRVSELAILKPSPLLIELKQEMADMKTDHQQAVKQEQKRANFAEDNLKNIASASEERVTSLELRVSELSEMVGNYDRLRQQDQQSILRLKDRVTQLDLENTALAQAAGSAVYVNPNDDYSKLDIPTLVEKILQLKNQLKIANEQSEFPIDLTDVFNLDNTEPESDIHSLCHQELEMLREEFESYKTRAQTVLKSKSVKQQDISKETEFLQRQVSDLRSRLQTSKSQSESNTEYYKKVEEKLQATVLELRTNYRHQVGSMESEHASKMVELEQQMQKQRERTMALLEEKDKELQLIKATVVSNAFLPDGLQMVDFRQSSSLLAAANSSDSEKHNIHSDSIADMLSQTMASKKGEQKILHYVQEIARKDVEIANLRRGRHQAESAVRELNCVVNNMEEEKELLESKVRLKSNQSEEGINMEYLKNVILRYVLCKETAGRKHMLNAIAAILHFTARELQQAKKSSVY